MSARNVALPDSQTAQTTPMPDDLLDALSEALSDALVEQIKADWRGESDAMAESPRGSDHAA